MNYFAHYQQQEYDPSSQNQQFYDQSTNYSYPQPNPQYTSIHPYPYQNLTVQPSQHEEQEPNPPGVTPPPPPEQSQSSYYLLTVCPQQGEVDTGVAGVHQPIVQSSYSGIGIINGIVPRGDAQTHLGPTPNVSHQPYHVHGRGRGHALHLNAATPSHIQGGPPQPLSQSYAESHLAPGQNVSGHLYRGRGRGRGRGKGRALQKHAPPPSALDKKVFIQGASNIQGGPSQPVPQSVASRFGQIPTPFQGPVQSAPVLLPPKAVYCDLCRVECNTIEILNQHMNGKKHKKKLKVFEELQNLNKRVICGQMEQTSTPELKSEVASQPDQIEGSANQQIQQGIIPSQGINEESQVAVEEPKLEKVETAEESVKKVRMDHSGGVGRGLKRKMRGGKGGRRTRPCDRSKKVVEPTKPKEVIPLVCELCNVKCESPVVFQSHLVGKKHQSKAKRFLSHQETLGQEPLQPQGPAMLALDQQNANASTSISSQLHDQGFGAYQGASTQNVQILNVQASILDAVSQPESLPTNFEASVLVNAEETSNKGHSEMGIVPSGALVSLPGADTMNGQVQSKGMDQAQ